MYVFGVANISCCDLQSTQRRWPKQKYHKLSQFYPKPLFGRQMARRIKNNGLFSPQGGKATSIQMQPHDFDRIFNMQKVNQSESSQDIEMRETQAVSPDSMVREDPSSEAIPPPNGWRCYWKRCTFLAMLLLCSLMLGFGTNASPANVQGVDARAAGVPPTPQELEKDFMVFCPATDEEVGGYEGNTDLRRRLLTGKGKVSYKANLEKAGSDYLHNRTYIVSAKSVMIGTKKKLRYCGRARRLSESCAESYSDLCLGKPMFDLLVLQEIDIIWVNALDPNIVPQAYGDCIEANSADDNKCSLHLRLSDKTFSDPTVVNHTEARSSADMMRISKTNWPISTHVHGAEIRPTFDGNPLSWISNNKEKKNGLGAFSMKDDWYYGKFEQSPDQKVKLLPPKFLLRDASGQQISNFKVNRYPNRQNPGTLWFHDHSMRLTSYNVAGGLSGFYLLRDPDVEDKMKELQAQERFVMLDAVNITGLSDLTANTVYRFRFLNANYDSASTIKYSFGYGDCGKQGPIGQTIKFSLIGADSSLFRTSLDDQQSFVISNGERVELLIVFPENTQSQTVSICGSKASQAKFTGRHHSELETNKPLSGPNSIYNIKNIMISKQSKEIRSFTPDSIKGLRFECVAYFNLTDAEYENKVAVKRMRPLIDGAGKFTIHGRADFHSGKSENPKIGDIEDWFIINTYNGMPHPIHVHLINFQVVRQYDLRIFESKCSLYGMDFYAAAIKHSATSPDPADHYSDIDQLYEEIFVNERVEYTTACKKFDSIAFMPNLQKALAQIYPEDVVDGNKISGLDVLKKCTQEDDEHLQQYGMGCMETGDYYIVNPNGDPHRQSFFGRWKDTAFVEGFKVFQYRIRWAKSEYRQEQHGSKYFNVPSDQLREYPGFVYHCHILGHEDNEMMRPIMLQLPDGVTPNATCPQVVWNEKAACINGPNKH